MAAVRQLEVNKENRIRDLRTERDLTQDVERQNEKVWD